MINLLAHAPVYHYTEYTALAVLVLAVMIIPKWDKNK